MPDKTYRMPFVGTGTAADPVRPKYGMHAVVRSGGPGEGIVTIYADDPDGQKAAEADPKVTELKTDADVAAVKTEWGL